MIKLICFDLDGCLIDAKHIHYKALNKALHNVDEKYIIDYDDHLRNYDGLPTKDKLLKLTQRKDLNSKHYNIIKLEKQKYTIEYINELIHKDLDKINLFHLLKSGGYKIYVTSNSIKQTIETAIDAIGVTQYVDYIISNEDVDYSKPHSEIYLRAFVHAGVNPEEVLIIEDSVNGREAANKSGAHVYGVECVGDVNSINIKNKLDSIKEKKYMWQGNKYNIVIPMAGLGSRFKEKGYKMPKPLIDVNGETMIKLVTDNLNIDANFIYIVQKEHYEQYNLELYLKSIKSNCKIVVIDGITDGAARTVLYAEDLIDNDRHLIITNSDQFFEWNSDEFYYILESHPAIDGCTLTFESKDLNPKWSYAKLGEDNYVTEVAEKRVISNNANCGLYYFNKGSDFVEGAKKMIEKDIRTNNEFFIAPVYNELIQDGKKIINYDIEKFWGLGVPEDLEHYLEHYNK